MTSKNFVVFDSLGKITRILCVSEEDILKNINNDEMYVEGVANINLDYVENNVITKLPEKPNGEYVFNYDTKQWVFDRETADTKAKQQRDRLLADGPDRISPMWWSSMSEQEQQAWTFYRQALLDITEQVDYPEFIVWPIKP